MARGLLHLWERACLRAMLPGTVQGPSRQHSAAHHGPGFQILGRHSLVFRGANELSRGFVRTGNVSQLERIERNVPVIACLSFRPAIYGRVAQ